MFHSLTIEQKFSFSDLRSQISNAKKTTGCTARAANVFTLRGLRDDEFICSDVHVVVIPQAEKEGVCALCVQNRENLICSFESTEEVENFFRICT